MGGFAISELGRRYEDECPAREEAIAAAFRRFPGRPTVLTCEVDYEGISDLAGVVQDSIEEIIPGGSPPEFDFAAAQVRERAFRADEVADDPTLIARGRSDWFDVVNVQRHASRGGPP